MASAVDTQHVRAKNKIEMWDHDPNGTSAAVTTPDAGTTERWFDMRDFSNFLVSAMSSALTGAGISLLEIVAADDTAGTNVTQVKTSGAIVADAVGDWATLECSAEEVRDLAANAGTTLRYVAARLTMVNAADEAVVMYMGCGARFPRNDLTPATTIA